MPFIKLILVEKSIRPRFFSSRGTTIRSLLQNEEGYDFDLDRSHYELDGQKINIDDRLPTDKTDKALLLIIHPYQPANDKERKEDELRRLRKRVSDLEWERDLRRGNVL